MESVTEIHLDKYLENEDIVHRVAEAILHISKVPVPNDQAPGLIGSQKKPRGYFWGSAGFYPFSLEVFALYCRLDWQHQILSDIWKVFQARISNSGINVHLQRVSLFQAIQLRLGSALDK